MLATAAPSQSSADVDDPSAHTEDLECASEGKATAEEWFLARFDASGFAQYVRDPAQPQTVLLTRDEVREARSGDSFVPDGR